MTAGEPVSSAGIELQGAMLPCPGGYDAGNISTIKPIPTDVEAIIKSGPLPYPDEFPRDKNNNIRFPVSVLKHQQQNGDICT